MTSKKSLATALIAASLAFCPMATAASSPLKVLTTTTDLRALVAEVGGQEVAVEALCKGSQDPHFLEAKPSFMVKANAADLIVAVGLGLEVGWLPNILQGGRNAKVMPGQPGYLEAGSLIEVIERPAGSISRDQGDVHPEGNPHLTLDPIRAGIVAQGIAERLATLVPSQAAAFKARATALAQRLADKSEAWNARIKATGTTKVVTYHKTLNYFLTRFGIETAGYLEPLPGVPPTAKHIVGIIETVKADKIRLILIENYFDGGIAKRIEQDAPGLRIATVPVAVEGADGIETLDNLYERIVATIEGKGP